MTSQELINKIISHFPNYRTSKFLKKFDETEYKNVIDLYDETKYKKFTFDDWYNLSEIYKKDKEMQIALVLHPAIPDDIIYKIVANKSYQDVYAAVISCKDKIMPKNATSFCLEKISQKNLLNLFKYGENVNRPVESINVTASNLIAQDVVNQLRKNPDIKLEPYQIHCCYFFNNLDLNPILFEMITEMDELPEDFVTAISSNENVPYDLRDGMFPKGANYLMLTNATKNMFNDIYDTIIDSIMSVDNKGLNEGFSSDMSTLVILQLMEQGMPDYLEKDMVMRYKDISAIGYPKPNVLTKLIDTTKNDNILKEISQIRFHHSFVLRDARDRIARSNRFSDNVVMPLLLNSAYATTTDTHIDTNDVLTLSKAAEIRRFSDEVYDTLLTPIVEKDKDKIGQLKYLYSNICTYYTPINVLEIISKSTQHIEPEVYYKSEIIKNAKEQNLDKVSIDVLEQLFHHKKFRHWQPEQKTDYNILMNFLNQMQDKYSSDTGFLDLLNSIQHQMYNHINEKYSTSVENEIIYDIHYDNVKHKFQAYLEFHKCMNRMNKELFKVEKVIEQVQDKFKTKFPSHTVKESER